MKGAEGPGRGGLRGCGERELAPDRRSQGGDMASPWGVLCATGPGVRSRPPPPVCARASPRPARSPGSPSTQPRAHATNARNSDFFKVPLKPRAGPEGWGSCTWARARVSRGGVPFGSRSSTPAAGWTVVGAPLPGKTPYARPQPSGGALGAGGAQSPIVAWGRPPQSGFCFSTNSEAGTTDCRPRAEGGLRARRVNRPGVSPPPTHWG